jgi:hypothetical protein
MRVRQRIDTRSFPTRRGRKAGCSHLRGATWPSAARCTPHLLVPSRSGSLIPTPIPGTDRIVWISETFIILSSNACAAGYGALPGRSLLLVIVAIVLAFGVAGMRAWRRWERVMYIVRGVRENKGENESETHGTHGTVMVRAGQRCGGGSGCCQCTNAGRKGSNRRQATWWRHVLSVGLRMVPSSAVRWCFDAVLSCVVLQHTALMHTLYTLHRSLASHVPL